MRRKPGPLKAAPAPSVRRLAGLALGVLGSIGWLAPACAAPALAAPKHLAAGTVYTWSATGSSANWSDAGSWTPSRTAPAATDVLQFSSSAAATTVVLDFTTSQSIGKLLISSGVSVAFSTDGARTLTVSDGTTDTDLSVGSGAAFTLYLANGGTLGSTLNGLTLKLGTGATASVAGRVVFDAAVASTGSAVTHTFQGNGAGSIEFVGGSVCTAQPNFRGNAFGTSAALANSVLFRNGSRYESNGGMSPFVLTQPSAITVFEPNSTFVFAPLTSVAPSLGGRTYGNLEYNMPSRTATSSQDNGTLTVAGNLIMTAGTANLNFGGGVLLKGNLLLNGGTLNFSPSGTATVQFGGAAAQTIGGTGAGSSLTFSSGVTVQLSNPAGLTLALPLSVPGTLQLTSGLLTTDASNILSLPATAGVTEASNTSFVNGPVRRPIGTISSATSFVFPVGKGANYRPITLTIATQTGTTNYRAEQLEGNAGRTLAATDPSSTPLTRVSSRRYFTLTPYSSDPVPVVTQPSGFTGTVTLSFGADDNVTDPTAGTLVVAKRSGATQPWYNFGHSAHSGAASAGTLTSGTITSFSDFALASTDPALATNPLPVRLVAFAATRTAAGPVALAWTTATELRSDRFEVERSLDGQAFAQVVTVPAQGTSAQATSYAARDVAAPAGARYYRLKLVDTDGTFAYSPTVVVGSGPGSELVLSPNPARDQLTFYTELPTAYAVRSVLGQEVRAGITAPGPTQLDVAGLASGVYLLEVRTNVGRVVRRFVKE